MTKLFFFSMLVNDFHNSLALIYQTSAETSVDSGVKIIFHACEIHETCVSGQLQCTDEWVLITG